MRERNGQFIIAYDLDKEGRNYPAIRKAIDQLGEAGETASSTGAKGRKAMDGLSNASGQSSAYSANEIASDRSVYVVTG
jgi:hypothetical protein